jgi:hypothetical protein
MMMIDDLQIVMWDVGDPLAKDFCMAGDLQVLSTLGSDALSLSLLIQGSAHERAFLQSSFLRLTLRAHVGCLNLCSHLRLQVDYIRYML